ncbi:Crp/Fnr family transcriptional regulator (plasmid) [Deinococcus sp. KNUC1210]|uniref:Crp/Fnr family transcriptional regulator n=1 Tax=Deinococcus sp. KNUC1210 TaxID=2917691 RepID=UPI001EF0B246|nr:Crp/Fnr family transcriptional regulator [Deinococcus sp. KNUC1210]ULH14137.1 Crp/Fnr family transcriptional regulator [Deinococcus sp. KNUC1210]
MLPTFLHALTAEARASVLSSTRSLQWSRGSLLHHSDDQAEAAYALTSGHVRLYRLGAGAREVTVSVHGQGEVLGMATLTPGSVYGLYAEAMDDVEALVLGGDNLRSLIRQHPDMAVALTAQVSRQTRTLHERLSQLVFLEVSQRLALALLQLAHESQPENHAETSSVQIALKGRISHQDLAYVVGSTRETITKLLGDFRGRGLLDLGYRRIVITDVAGLQEAARKPLGA